MAVLVEAYSVIVRRDSIEKHFIGGWKAFLRNIPNATSCYEEELVRVGFMDPGSVRHYVDQLEQSGLIFLENDKAVDIVVCDQFDGPTTACDWIEFGKLPIDDKRKVSAAWLFEGTRFEGSLHFKGLRIELNMPARWKYEGSLSEKPGYMDKVDCQNHLEFLRKENSVEVYWNKITNKEVYVGRVSGGEPFAPRKRLN